MPDAVVIGAGPNGLVGANMLAEAGWDVVVVEQQPEPGGAVKSDDGPLEGFVRDLCSAFYPLSAVSAPLQSMRLEQHGLTWRHAPHVLAHPLPDGRAAILDRDLDVTAGGLEDLAEGDGDAWRRLHGLWERIGSDLLSMIFVPFPPVVAAARLAARLGPTGLLRFGRFATLPVRRLAEEEFAGPGSLLVAGCALHADLMPESAGSSAFGWLLSMLGQQVGFPVPQGGAGKLTGALVHRLQAHGGTLVCDRRVEEVVVRKGRAVAVRTADGEEIEATQAVLADVDAGQLYGDLVSWDHLPARLRDDLRRFQWDYSTVKVDWALDGGVPWTAPEVAKAGTVHVSAGMDEMTEYTAQIAMGRVPERPFLLVGQMTTSDPTRSPAGTEALWAYTHVPRSVRGDAGDAGLSGRWDADERERFADRMQQQIERYAPGFADRVMAREVSGPDQLRGHDANLVGGAINGGTTSIHQQLVFRPTPGTGRPETPVVGLYLASASAHPGGAVHGACGANAARAALRGRQLRTQAALAGLSRWLMH